jgi:SAM-dependent methyltransferase
VWARGVRIAGAAISFQACSFEDFAAPGSSFDLIVSATAFHWIDPEVRFSKSARLLRPGGWLVLLSIGEHYDEPLNTALRGMWAARSEDKAWAVRKPPADADAIIGSGLFGPPCTGRTGTAPPLPRPRSSGWRTPGRPR